jgi:epoxyqueuosine reductase QueG
VDRDVIEGIVSGFVGAYPRRLNTATRWRTPILGIAAASDPLFARFKQVVRPSHSLPEDLLPGARTVIAWFVPFGVALGLENAEYGLCARSWAIAYVETNRLIDELSRHLAWALQEAGHRAALVPPTHNFDEASLMSDWSHRHAAYAAGVGTFGLHNLLITKRGCSGRVGSLITDLELAPTPRLAGEHCLHKAGHTCRACLDRCTFGALSLDGFDRVACYRQCLRNAEAHRDVGLVDVCGKCTAGVPCSNKSPGA